MRGEFWTYIDALDYGKISVDSPSGKVYSFSGDFMSNAHKYAEERGMEIVGIDHEGNFVLKKKCTCERGMEIVSPDVINKERA